MKEMKQKHI